ncbi:MAG TPA: CDGSH iron-sulfur domain-containing protein [Gemmatimonadales bacterium]|nr:CDGSH iron-sulfur domain-containing protein [Gemmatimonadales bacterium]
MSDQSTPVPPVPVTITWKPAGPVIIEGPVVIRDNEGTELVPPPTKVPGQVKLCGCGHSKTKPFCDGSHKR